MAARKSRLFGKILTGVLTTIIAPAVASVVAQQVTQWQDTVKYVVENHLPGNTADWNRPVAETNANRLEAGNRKKSAEPPAVLLPPVSKSASCGR